MAEPGQDDTDTQTRRVGVCEFRGNLAEFLRQARHGRSFIITSHNEALAELHPPSHAERRRRQPGALRGKIRIATDFDMLSPDILAAMEGEAE